MALIEDAKAAEAAASKVVAELENPGAPEEGTYVLTQTAEGQTLVLTPNPTPATPAGEPPAEPPLPPQTE